MRMNIEAFGTIQRLYYKLLVWQIDQLNRFVLKVVIFIMSIYASFQLEYLKLKHNMNRLALRILI
jgi:hypothetical protein